jgi:hypothetical protein
MEPEYSHQRTTRAPGTGGTKQPHSYRIDPRACKEFLLEKRIIAGLCLAHVETVTASHQRQYLR